MIISGKTGQFKPVQSCCCCCCCKSTRSLSALAVSDSDPHMDQRISSDVLTNNYSFRVRPHPVVQGHSTSYTEVAQVMKDWSKNKASRAFVRFAAGSPGELGSSSFAGSHVLRTDHLSEAPTQFYHHHCTFSANWQPHSIAHPLRVLYPESSLWVFKHLLTEQNCFSLRSL